MHALVIFSLLPRGFTNRDLRQRVAPLLGVAPAQWSSGRITYDLRRLRLPGLIQCLPRSHRYGATPEGLRIVLFFTRIYGRVLRPGLSLKGHVLVESPPELRALDEALKRFIDRRLRLAA